MFNLAQCKLGKNESDSIRIDTNQVFKPYHSEILYPNHFLEMKMDWKFDSYYFGLNPINFYLILHRATLKTCFRIGLTVALFCRIGHQSEKMFNLARCKLAKNESDNPNWYKPSFQTVSFRDFKSESFLEMKMDWKFDLYYFGLNPINFYLILHRATLKTFFWIRLTVALFVPIGHQSKKMLNLARCKLAKNESDSIRIDTNQVFNLYYPKMLNPNYIFHWLNGIEMD